MCALEAQRPTALPAPRSPQKSAWSVDPQFQLRIAPNDTLEFGMVIGLSMLSDGGVVLASHRSNSIQFFDAQGRRTKSVGRRGRGPGEFTGVSQFLRFGDTLVLVDLRGIAQLFSSTGKYVRSESKLGSNVERLGYFSNGDRLVSTSMTDHLSPGRWEQTHDELTRISSSSSVLLGSFPSVEAMRNAGGALSGKVYAPRNRVAVLKETFCAGYNGAFRFDCFDQRGKKISTVERKGVKVKPVTNDDKEAYFAGIYEANKTTPEIANDMQQVRARVQFSERFPAFGEWSPHKTTWSGSDHQASKISSSPIRILYRKVQRYGRYTR